MAIGMFYPRGLVCKLLTRHTRSPSPPPQYDNHGRRVNTREYRYRKRLEDERHKLVERAMKTIPNYHPPQDYRRPTKTQEKVYVPVNDYPEINFSMIANPLTLLTVSPPLSCLLTRRVPAHGPKCPDRLVMLGRTCAALCPPSLARH